jgi:guanylate kinase
LTWQEADVSEAKSSGVLLIVSGPSGVGKSTVCRRAADALDAFLSVSATTRPKRPYEVDGEDYRFMSTEAFEKQLEQGGFLEHAKVYSGYYYGTPAAPVEEQLALGRVVILEIEIDGTIQVVRRKPEAIGVYLLAPSPQDQASRLTGRRSDSDQAIEERLSKADGEIRWAQECGAYQHFIVNNEIEETVAEIVAIAREGQSA